MLPVDAIRATSSRETRQPKTALAFFATVLAIVASSGIALVSFLAAKGHTTFAAVVGSIAFLTFVGIVIWVMRALDRNPTPLVVGPITGSELLAYQQWRSGDSQSGDVLVTTPPPGLVEPPGRGSLALPKADENE